MLVLSRKIGERIVVPNCELVLTVIAVHGKAARIGVSAPGGCKVYREEIWLRLCDERTQQIGQDDVVGPSSGGASPRQVIRARGQQNSGAL